MGDEDEHWVAELFKPQNSEGENMFSAWYKASGEILMLNALREENQGRIAEWLGCGNDFNDEIDLGSSAGRLSGLERYRILTRCAMETRVKQIEKDGDELHVVMSMIEGNNRVWDMIHLYYNAKFSEKDGIIEEDSLTTDWVISHMLDKPGRYEEEIKERMANAGGTIKQWLEQEIQNDSSVFCQNFRLYIHYGVDRDAFLQHGISMEQAQKIVISKSQNLMLHKKLCADVPIRVLLANTLHQVINEIDVNQKMYPSSLHPTFSANGLHYVESEPINKSIPTPKDADGKPIKNAEKPCVEICKLWLTPEYQIMERDPSIANFRAFINAVDVGMVSFRGKTPIAANRTCHGPFILDEVGMFKANGDFFNEPKDDAARKKNSHEKRGAKAQTITKQWELENRAHLPLAIEEFNKAIFITMVAPLVYQATKLISQETWQQHAEGRKQCLEHTRFLVQANIHTAACGNTFGAKLGKEYKTKSYGSIVGVESTVLDENNTHLCAILFLADALNACLSLGRQKGIKKAREFIAMISCSVYDSSVTDKGFLDILGEIQFQEISKGSFIFY